MVRKIISINIIIFFLISPILVFADENKYEGYLTQFAGQIWSGGKPGGWKQHLILNSTSPNNVVYILRFNSKTKFEGIKSTKQGQEIPTGEENRYYIEGKIDRKAPPVDVPTSGNKMIPAPTLIVIKMKKL